MHSKNLIQLQDTDGFVDISSIMKAEELSYYTPYLKQTFKTDDNIMVFWKPRLASSYSHFGEVISSHLARQWGLRSTKYFFAKWDGVRGTISPDYKKTNEIEILGIDFLVNYCREVHSNSDYLIKYEKINSITFIKEALDYYVKKHNSKKTSVDEFSIDKQDAKKIFEKILLNYMFDIAVLNADCHYRNWGILVDKKTRKVRLIPNIDKERGFLLYSEKDELLKFVQNYNNNPTKRNLMKMEQQLKQQSDLHRPGLSVLPEEYVDGYKEKHYLDNLEELKQLFPDEFEKLLKKFYGLNLLKAFDSVENETGVKVPELIKLVTQNAYETRYFEVKNRFGYTKEETEQDKESSF